MIELIVVGIVAGFLAGISPCILPALPIVLVAGAGPAPGTEPASPGLDRPGPANYRFPASLPLGAMGLSGTWTDHAQEATAGHGAELELGFLAKDVYLVLGGTGTLDVSVNGHHTKTIDVHGVPRLYTLYQAGSASNGKLLLHASPGVEAYDFTFG